MTSIKTTSCSPVHWTFLSFDVSTLQFKWQLVKLIPLSSELKLFNVINLKPKSFVKDKFKLKLRSALAKSKTKEIKGDMRLYKSENYTDFYTG